jgi:hypothetical protein
MEVPGTEHHNQLPPHQDTRHQHDPQHRVKRPLG